MKTLMPLIAAGGLSVLSGSAFAQTAWDMPTPYPEGNFHEKNIAEFIEDVSGAVTITPHYNQTLIKHPEIKASVRDGIVPIGELLVSRLENEDAIFGADSVPFLATSYEDAKRLYDAQKPLMEEALSREGLKLLFSVPWPPQGLWTKEPAETMADLSGRTFRAYNTATEELASAAGMVPTQVEASDIPTAFSTGRVSAMMTSPATGVDSKAWDYLEYYYPMNAWLPRNMVIVNQAAFDALPEDAQTMIVDAATAAETRGWEASKAETERTTKIAADNGIKVTEPSEDLKSGFQAIGDQMAGEWQDKAGEAGTKLMDAYKQ